MNPCYRNWCSRTLSLCVTEKYVINVINIKENIVEQKSMWVFHKTLLYYIFFIVTKLPLIFYNTNIWQPTYFFSRIYRFCLIYRFKQQFILKMPHIQWFLMQNSIFTLHWLLTLHRLNSFRIQIKVLYFSYVGKIEK